MPFPYNAVIPQATDEPRNSQPLILQNFASIQDLINVNHGGFSAATAGMHPFMTMPAQAAAPALYATGMQMYTKNGTVSGIPELYAKRANGTVLNCTEGLLAAGNGWASLPCGLKIAWGLFFAEIALVTTPFAAAFAAPPFAVFTQYYEPVGGPDFGSLVVLSTIAASFDSIGDLAHTRAYYFAIGI